MRGLSSSRLNMRWEVGVRRPCLVRIYNKDYIRDRSMSTPNRQRYSLLADGFIRRRIALAFIFTISPGVGGSVGGGSTTLSASDVVRGRLIHLLTLSIGRKGFF